MPTKIEVYGESARVGGLSWRAHGPAKIVWNKK